MWLEEELEIVHLDIGVSGEEPNDDFFQGAEINWRDLHLNNDCQRDIAEKLERRVEDDLARRRTTRVSLCHSPGAGGTTVAHRIVWNLHRRYPCAVLHRSDPVITADRISKLSALTENSVLLLVDSSELSEHAIDDIFDYVNVRQTPTVLLQVLRRFGAQKSGDRRFCLRAEMTPVEVDRFLVAYSQKVTSRRHDLERLARASDPQLKTAFYFGLQAFGKEFRGLEQYVADRVSALESDTQRRLMVFVAIAHHYAQQPLAIQSFVEEIGASRKRKLELAKVFPEHVFDLLQKVGHDFCRTSHAIIAEELLKQLLCPERRNREKLWKQRLSDWAIQFAWFLRGKWPVPPEGLVELARRSFVYRDNVELLGTERSSQNQHSHLIEQIPSNHGKGELLRELTAAFPDEAHFHAHLARFCGLRGTYDEALRKIEHAIRMQDGDSVLHHMKGMIYRYRMSDLMNKQAELADIIELGHQAASAFEKSRALNPENEHGYVSDIQMRIDILDYASRVIGCKPQVVAHDPEADPFLRESLDHAESLLEQARDCRGTNKPSFHEVQCSGRLDVFYGMYSEALQAWDHLLSQKDVVHGPVRRQIVWTILHRDKKRWENVKRKDLDRSVALLEKNMEEDIRDEKSLLMWLRAVRYLEFPHTLDRLLERVGYWKTNTNSVNAVFYLYVLNTLLAIEGSAIARLDAEKALDECRGLARSRRNSKRSIEWLAKGNGIQALRHQSQLGDWIDGFWEATGRGQLVRAEGRIASISAPQKGRIEFVGGQSAFFVPAVGNFHAGRDENRRVSMYLGFSYEGPRAWVVKAV